MLSIVILLLIIFIINITSVYTKNNIKLKKKIKYTYVPKSIYDYQFSDIELINKYNNIFNYDEDNIDKNAYEELDDKEFQNIINSNNETLGNFESLEKEYW